MEKDSAMDPDCSDGINHQTLILRRKPLVATPVSAGSSGEGLPYAPEDWPCPGDVWGWKVGRRMSVRGYWVDRCLRLPRRLLKDKVLGSKHAFYSRILVEHYVREQFPEADVRSFFDSFIWKIPCKDHTARKGKDGNESIYAFPQRFSMSTSLESHPKALVEYGGCKAGNKMCSLRMKARAYSSATLECDICCSEAGFCQDCCCILCCKTIDWAYDGYSFIRCEAKIDENVICGHAAHLDCALRAYMAGTVGGSIGLDAEYYCRRCDNKTDMISHVSRILHTCQSLDCRDDVEKILKLASQVLHGSEQMRANILQTHVKSVMAKLQSGVCLGDIWKEDDSVPVVTTGLASTNAVILLGALDTTGNQGPRDILSELESSVGKEIIDQRTLDHSCINSDLEVVSIKLEDEVDQALRELRKSQESEYTVAERKLYSRKDYLLSLYHQLAVDRSELAKQISSQNKGDYKFLLANVLNRINHIKQEESKLRQMMLISKGFGQAPKQVLKEHFQLAIDD